MTRGRFTAAAAALALGAAPLLGAPSATAAAADPSTVYRVAGAAPRAAELVARGVDLLERRTGDDLYVLGGDVERVAALGLTATPQGPAAAPVTTRSAAAGTYYGGYRTVAGQYAHLDSVAAAHPDLAAVVTYGQSWLKTQGRGGNDLRAICLTKITGADCSRSAGGKPKFFLMAQVHSREISTGEVAYRWVDHLVDGYGTDPAVTALMDSTEMWVVPVANPDGVDIVASGGDDPILQRKNANDSHGDCGTGSTGVDLNRNADSHWGYSGTSDDPCSEVFLGPAPDSEVENSALESLFSDLWADRRADGDATAAPADTTGMFITLHADAAQVIFPWGHDAAVHTGNDAALRAFGAEMGDVLGYESGQAGEILYDSAGGTEDWVYDKLGVAAYTIEVGDNEGRGCGGFLPPYSCQDSYYFPKLLPALVLAAQKAAAPYAS
ncbi:M14 family zinc carboxypeptidase [Actinokineospora bangkokensis]|uniref:Zinc carboxypeptidase n=1 Tax=Actinokineospora bangkokensis TaxID=1193682 RepID=A0A1Q9LDU2_9PSEU|nr:M14 family zinc carboxypeptidase [Actinokineospora bangkokensis]OLR90175.1 carboxypeptidase [Actinokineospora bangkokensis]